MPHGHGIIDLHVVHIQYIFIYMRLFYTVYALRGVASSFLAYYEDMICLSSGNLMYNVYQNPVRDLSSVLRTHVQLHWLGGRHSPISRPGLMRMSVKANSMGAVLSWHSVRRRATLSRARRYRPPRPTSG